MEVNENIFRAYDIRGIYKKQITEELAYKLGRAFATFNKGKIVVGRDARIGGDELKDALVNGLMAGGVDVVDVGIVPTPLVIFSIGYYGCGGGICITASHNPKEFQGFLLYDKSGVGIGLDNGLEEIKKHVFLENFDNGCGCLEKKDILQDYEKFILNKISLKKINKKIVVDCGNGVSSVVLGVIEKFGVKVDKIFCELDGNFPDRNPEPTKENLKELQKKVIELKADCGFAYDGDCDRVVTVDENGKILNPNEFFGILIKLYLEKAGGKVVHDSIASGVIDEITRYYKGLPIGCRVGHVFIQKEVLKENALLGGEISGHYFFREIYGADDAIFATLKILEYLDKKKIKLSQAYKDIPNYYFKSLRVKTKDEIKFKLIEELKEKFKKAGYKLDTLDGVKVFLKEGWALFRASNTEPKISIAYEAKTKEDFEKLEKFVSEIVREIECKQ